MAKKKQNNKIPVVTAVTAIIVLGIIQCVALHYGIDGVFRATIAALIAGILGLTIPTPRFLTAK